MKKITQKVLKEEITKKEINLVKNFIQTFFNNVLFIEESVTFFGTPKLIVHFESSSKAINIESWFCGEICDKFKHYMGEDITILPVWSLRKDNSYLNKDLDIYIDCVKINKK